jgi:hypothetical protein
MEKDEGKMGVDIKVRQLAAVTLNLFSMPPVDEKYYNTLKSQYGVDVAMNAVKAAQQQLLDTEGLLTKLPQDVIDSNKQFQVTDASRRAIEARRREPLVEQMDQLGRVQARAQAGLDNSMNAINQAIGIRTTSEDRALEAPKYKVEMAKYGYEVGKALSDKELETMVAGISQDLQVDTETAKTMVQSIMAENDRTATFAQQDKTQAAAVAADQAAADKSFQNEVALRKIPQATSGGSGSSKGTVNASTLAQAKGIVNNIIANGGSITLASGKKATAASVINQLMQGQSQATQEALFQLIPDATDPNDVTKPKTFAEYLAQQKFNAGNSSDPFAE